MSKCSTALRILAALMAGAFVLCGIRGFAAARSRRTDGNGPLNSSDSFLLQALQVNGAGERYLSAISSLPPGQPLAIIAPGDNAYGPILGPTISAITWPREVYLVPLRKDNLGKILGTLQKDRFAAGLFYDVVLPFPKSTYRQIGLLTIVPIGK